MRCHSKVGCTPGHAAPEGPTQSQGPAPAWATGPTSSEGAVPVLVPGEAGAHPSALGGQESHHLLGSQARRLGGDVWPTRLAGSATVTRPASPCADQPLGADACPGREGREEDGCRGLQACLFWYQHRVSLSLRVPEEKRWTLPGGVRVRTWAEASEPQGLLHGLLGDLVKLLPVVPPHLGSVHVSAAFVIGL